MTRDQMAAILQLEAAFVACKRVGLAMCGVDGNLFIAVVDPEFQSECMKRSSCEVMLEMASADHQSCCTVNHRGFYRDSGGA